MKKIIFLIHGIRTTGAWQKQLTPFLVKQGWLPYPLDYDWFGLPRLVFNQARENKIKWLLSEYQRITQIEGTARPSVIAHSFGAYLVARMLYQYPDVKFDKVILCGSIVRQDFDWQRLFARDQVNIARNDYGLWDNWTSLASFVINDAGPSGKVGFSDQSDRLYDIKFDEHTHDDYFHHTHYEKYWIPFLRRTVLYSTERTSVVNYLDVTTQLVSQHLHIAHKYLRANVFCLEEDAVLRIPSGLHFNMDDPKELSISIPVGQGCTGTAFSDRKPAIAIFEEDWGRHTLPGSELSRVHPDLKWIISMPIMPLDNSCEILGILNVDCLKIAQTREELGHLELLKLVSGAAQTLGALLRR